MKGQKETKKKNWVKRVKESWKQMTVSDPTAPFLKIHPQPCRWQHFQMSCSVPLPNFYLSNKSFWIHQWIFFIWCMYICLLTWVCAERPVSQWALPLRANLCLHKRKKCGPTVWGRTPHGYWHQHVWLCEHMEAFCANKKGHKQQKKDAWTKQLFKKRLRFIATRKKKAK